MADDRVTEIPGVERWSYAAFQPDHENAVRTIPLRRNDGKSTEFTVLDFVADPEDLRRIATIVVRALEKWEDVEGVGG